MKMLWTWTSTDNAELKRELVSEESGLLGKGRVVVINLVVAFGIAVEDAVPEATEPEALRTTVTVQADGLPVAAEMVTGTSLLEAIAMGVTDELAVTVVGGFWRPTRVELLEVSDDKDEVCSLADAVDTEFVRTLLDEAEAVVPLRVGAETVTVTHVGCSSVTVPVGACALVGMEDSKVSESADDLTLVRGRGQGARGSS
ncbi:hypothetical protein C0992_003508 [Termitomyces sp. T32_za158]|nr:hypothetical protein C0992_003508 [Termitomyces sp. T32_za158]